MLDSIIRVKLMPKDDKSADLKAKNSPRKFRDPGIDMLAKIKVKNKALSKGMDIRSPL